MRISITSPSVRSSSSLIIPRRSSSGEDLRLSTILCIREFGLSIVGRKSRKNASMSSRMFLPPNYEPICLGHPGRPAHPRHADDPSLLDRTLDLLEHLNDRIALPDLRQLIPRDLEGLQDPIRVFLRDEPMLWDQLVLQYVKPQGGASLGVRPCSTWHVTARKPYGPAGTFGASARSAGPVRTPDHPVSFRSSVTTSG